jgi:hypothetical protein
MAKTGRKTALEHIRIAIRRHGKCARDELVQQFVEVKEMRWVWDLDDTEAKQMLYDTDTMIQALDRLIDLWK